MATSAHLAPALDESWASLDVSDFSHDDDDTQSVNTDPGSLVDLSSVNDTESAAGDESQDEQGGDEERAGPIPKRGVSRHSEQVGQPDLQDLSTCDNVEDTIIFQQSTIQDSEYSMNMEHVRDSASTSDSPSILRETITMTISPTKDLKPFDTPVRICYYGSPYSPNTKDELLGKIGAALLVPAGNPTSETPTTSTCFNIVPTEFGPGSKPAFADLIPSQTQMSVDELSVVLNPSDRKQYDTLHFALRRGVVMDSMLGNSPADNDCEDFRPDLLVIHLSEKDFKDRGSQFVGLRALARRHCWPTIVVADDEYFSSAAFDYAPKGYGIQITTDADGGSDLDQTIRPIDLDTFMALDTVQLSRHIRHIMDESYGNSPTEEHSLVSALRESCFGTIPRQYVLKLNQGKADGPLRRSSLSSRIGEIKQIWSTVEGRKYVKDVIFTLIVMMLGVYIVSFSQNLSTKVDKLVGLDNTTSVSSKTDGTATVTATSAIAITTTTSTATAASNQDVALYDPVSFDQMWHRLTGWPTHEQEEEKAPKEVVPEEKVTSQPEVIKNLTNSSTILDRFTQWLSPKINAVKKSTQDRQLVKYLKALPRHKKRAEMRDLHQKLQDFYNDVTVNVPKMSLSSQKHLQDLVTRSRHLLVKTRWAGEKKLEKLMNEQKMILSQAQHQARNFVSAEKKKRRPSFFKRGRRAFHRERV